MNFHECMEKLRDPCLIKKSYRFFLRIHAIANILVDVPVEKRIGRVAVRKLLAGLSIESFPEAIITQEPEKFNDLLDASTRLNAAIHGICVKVMSNKTLPFCDMHDTSLRQYHEIVCDYLIKFDAWKKKDVENLIAPIKDALMKLFDARRYVLAHPPFPEALLGKINDQIDGLSNQLKRLISGADYQAFISGIEERAIGAATTLISTPLEGETGTQAIVGTSAAADLFSDMESIRKSFMGLFVGHEILVNPALNIRDLDPLTEWPHAPPSFSAEFWDNLISDLKSNPVNLDGLFDVIHQITQNLVLLSSVQDSGFVQKILNKNVIQLCFAFPGDIQWNVLWQSFQMFFKHFETVQAPHRLGDFLSRYENCNADFQSASYEGKFVAFCDALKTLVDIVIETQMDAGNARIKSIAILMKTQGIAWEEGKFRKMLECGFFSIDGIKEFICDGIRIFQKSKCGKCGDTLRSIVIDSIVTRVSSLETITENNVPGTFYFDSKRLGKIQKQFHFDVRRASVVSALYVQDQKLSEDVMLAVKEYLFSESDVEINREEFTAKLIQSLAGMNVSGENIEMIREYSLLVFTPVFYKSSSVAEWATDYVSVALKSGQFGGENIYDPLGIKDFIPLFHEVSSFEIYIWFCVILILLFLDGP